MKIRRDPVLIASVLFTIALLCLIPWSWRDALADRDARSLENLDAGWQIAMQATSNFGAASLVIILIGLIVTWKGYAARVWLVMFIVAWVWAFPLLVLPLLTHKISLTFPEVLYSAMYEAGVPRIWVKSVLIFLLMVIALLMPMKSFLFVREIPEPSRKPSIRVMTASGVAVLVAVTVLWMWIRFRLRDYA